MGLGAAVIGASVLGAGASVYGAQTGAAAQRSSVTSANALQQSMFNTTQQNLAPYIQGGNTAGNQLFSMLNDSGPNGLLTPFNPTQAQLEQTPGYQFTLQQGTNAVNNANSAKGWGDSGPGAKGLANYVTGLASNTYQQQFTNYWTQKQNQFGDLFQPYQIGANAATGQGQISASVGNQIGQNTIGAGNATAAADIGTGSTINNAPFNALTEYRLLDQTLNPQNYGGLFGSLANPQYTGLPNGYPVGTKPL